jgi:hypothetical protein
MRMASSLVLSCPLRDFSIRSRAIGSNLVMIGVGMTPSSQGNSSALFFVPSSTQPLEIDTLPHEIKY